MAIKVSERLFSVKLVGLQHPFIISNERVTCTEFIPHTLETAKWVKQTWIMNEACFTDGKIIFRGKWTEERDAKKQAGYYLHNKHLFVFAIIDAPNYKHTEQNCQDYSRQLQQQNVDSYTSFRDVRTVHLCRIGFN